MGSHFVLSLRPCILVACFQLLVFFSLFFFFALFFISFFSKSPPPPSSPFFLTMDAFDNMEEQMSGIDKKTPEEAINNNNQTSETTNESVNEDIEKLKKVHSNFLPILPNRSNPFFSPPPPPPPPPTTTTTNSRLDFGFTIFYAKK